MGRSNVGKSTLLNALLGLEASMAWNDKANVSDKPGETTQLCFYGVGGWTRGRGRTSLDLDQGTRARSHTDMDEWTGIGTRTGTGTRARPRQSTPALVITDMPGFGFAFLNEGIHVHTIHYTTVTLSLNSQSSTHFLTFPLTKYPFHLFIPLPLFYAMMLFYHVTMCSAETKRCRDVTRAYLHGSHGTPSDGSSNSNIGTDFSPTAGASLSPSSRPTATFGPTPGASPSPGASASSSPGASPSPRPRASLKRVLFLVDGRHGLKHTDATFLQVHNIFYPCHTYIYTLICQSDTEILHFSPFLQQLFIVPSDSSNNGDSNDLNYGAPTDNSNYDNDGNMRRHLPSTKSPSPKLKLQIVLTKCDLVERNDLARRMVAVHGQLRCVMCFLLL